MRFPTMVKRLPASLAAALMLLTIEASGTAQTRSANPPSLVGPPVPQAATSGPAIRVTLSRPLYYITCDAKTGAPQMPRDIVAKAEPVDWPTGAPHPAVYRWRVCLDWDFEAFPTHHCISELLFKQPSPFAINLNQQIRGGLLKVYAKADLNGKEILGQGCALVLGTNPSRKALLAAYPPSRFGLIASKIGMAESGLRQFTSANGVDPGGTPVLSRTKDVGMMQINAPSGAVTSADQVWDWRANVRRGLEMLQGKRRTSVLASRHSSGRWQERIPEGTTSAADVMASLNVVRVLLGMECLPVPEVPPLSEKPGTGLLPAEDDPDHLALSQLERDAIRRYNGGREYAFVVQPDPNTLGIAQAGWEVDPTRGGIRPNSGAPDYVHRVLRARSGFTLPPPPKPAAKPTTRRKHGRSHRHRRNREH